MPKRDHVAHATPHQRHQLSPEEKREHKLRVLTQGAPSVTGSIDNAVVVKNGDLFFLTNPDGIIPLGGDHGFGLYYHDCRYLSGYELMLAGATPIRLVSTDAEGSVAAFQFTNPDITMPDGAIIRKEGIGVKWERMLDINKLGLDELITIENYETQAIEFPLTLSFEAGFEDVFAIRGLLPEVLGRMRPPEWRSGALHFLYEGADDLYRSLSVHFSLKPDLTDWTSVHFDVRLQPRERWNLSISFLISETDNISKAFAGPAHGDEFSQVRERLRRECDDWVEEGPELRSDSLLLDAIMDRSFRDLHALRSEQRRYVYFAAGVPWFVTLFGRDSIITSLQTLAYNPNIAEQTLRLLATYQSRHMDPWRDAEPGKILHEIRTGEMAKLGEIPHTPYYGTIDATPLFLILFGRHAAWTGDLMLFNDLRENVELALEWMDKYGDLNGDGYLEYHCASEKGLVNQGWKDSGDAIVNVDGKLGTPPIALVEAQGYAYLAKREIAALFRRVGENERAARLEREADELRERFNRDFWMEEKGIYALALQADQRPVAVISSNSGHALWAGIADEKKARCVMDRLMANDIYSGWGIRTLSDKEKRYNPIGYHLGTVWPHDNSIIAAGFKRYGFDDAAMRIFTGIMRAAMHFKPYRLPELFSGFSERDFNVPVRYPVACQIQAWAAGSLPYMIETTLGLTPEAFERRLRVVRPQLPDFVYWLELRRLRVGDAIVDLRFDRQPDGKVMFEVMRIDGQLEVIG